MGQVEGGGCFVPGRRHLQFFGLQKNYISTIFNLSIYTDENVLASTPNPRPSEEEFYVRAARRF